MFGLGLGKARDTIKEGFVEAYRVPSAGMAETIQPGDWLYVDKREAGRIAPTRNALIVYRSPDDRTLALKRVVGVASKDSRHVGLIPLEMVVGTPSVVYYGYDPEGDWPFPALTAIRWQRLGMRLR